MPELWLPYGEVEVSLDVRAENLAEVITSQPPKLDDASLKEKLRQAPLKPGTSLVLADCQQATLQFLGIAISMLPELGIAPEFLLVQCPEQHLYKVKKVCENSGVKVTQIGRPDQRIGEVDNVEVIAPTALSNSQTLIITETRLNPLFGFSGGPASLLRLMNDEVMSEAFSRRSDDNPHPGKNTPSSDFSDTVSHAFETVPSIEIVSIAGQTADIFSGGLIETHRQAVKGAAEFVTHEVTQPAKIVVLSPGRGFDSTLSSSLSSTWNVLGALREKGWLIIAAECSEGLGSEAAELFLTGRIRIETKKYVRGLEDLVFLRNITAGHSIVIVSALPHYFLATKLGLQVARRLEEAFGTALDSLGSRTKAHVITSSSDALLKSKES